MNLKFWMKAIRRAIYIAYRHTFRSGRYDLRLFVTYFRWFLKGYVEDRYVDNDQDENPTPLAGW